MVDSDTSLVFLQDKKDKNLQDKTKWQLKKIRSLMLADSFKRLGQYRRAYRVVHCGEFLEFAVYGTGEVHLHNANFCRERLCPMCAWRRSLKIYYQVSKVMDKFQILYPDYKPIFLTLTVKNVSARFLSSTLDNMFKAWRNLTDKRSKVGKMFSKVFPAWFRSLEVTHNSVTDEYHPHFHVILFARESYFTGRDYLNTRDWVKMWRSALGVDYNPVCFVEAVNSGANAIKEVSKYSVKDTDYITEDSELMDKLVSVLSAALKGRRLYAFGGRLRKIAHDVSVDVDDDTDLIHVDDNVRDDVAVAVYRFNWSLGYCNYVLSAIDVPEKVTDNH